MNEKIDAYASLPHYLDALAPVWRALPEALRGDLMVPMSLIPRAELRGCERAQPMREGMNPYALCASYVDLSERTGGGRQKVILMEHGSGQSYGGDPQAEIATHPAYAGGRQRDDVILFLNPGDHPTKRNGDAYPNAVSLAVGSPQVDELRARPPVSHEPTIAFTWHYNAQVCPEAMSAFEYWKEATVAALVNSGYQVIATSHPRADGVYGFYDMRRTEFVSEFEEVVDRADILIADNTSAMYVWAALGRPVIALNDPSWRRSVRHGLRFWDHVPGRQCDTLGEFEDAMASILPQEVMVSEPLPAARAAYAHLDGTATARCVEAIEAVLETVRQRVRA